MSEIENKTLSVIQSFNDSFEKSNLADSLAQIGEVGIDYALEASEAAPILKDIPVLGLIVSGTRTVANIRSLVLAKKIYHFFYAIKDIPLEKRQKFAEEYCLENKENVAEALLGVLDRLNNQNYVPIICNLMRAKMYGFITIPEFNRAILALERIPYSDIQSLHAYLNDHFVPGETEMLYAAGVLYLSHEDFENSTNEYMLNQNGFVLLKYGLGVDVQFPADYRIKRLSVITDEEIDDITKDGQ